MLSLKQDKSFSLESIYWLFSAMVLVSLGLAIFFETYLLLLIPIFLLGALVTISEYKLIFYLFFAVVPFSVEIYLDNGLGTDLPTEPLAVLLTGIAIALFCYRFDKIDLKFVKHPISVILILHMLWIMFVCFFSQDLIVSLKYLLAKTWYVVPFYALPFYLFKERKDLEVVVKILIAFTALVMTIIMVKHAMTGFTFKAINKAAHPMYRNHVIYAALLVLLMPYIWFFYRKAKTKLGWIALASIFLIAIYLTYTRAAYVCVVLMMGAFFVIKYRFGRLAVFTSLLVAAVSVFSLVNKNNYLEFAPEYKKTVTHIKFNNLIEATYKFEDISTMERVYRWVAGLQMVKDRPLLGFGPACFFNNYKDYVVSSFRTYVSHNPDKSGIHNYFFMILVEQGVFGLIIVLFLCVFPILYGEQVYHRLTDKNDKNFVMAAILCLIAFNAMLIINDLVETDKLGSFFWLNLSFIVILGLRQSQKT